MHPVITMHARPRQTDGQTYVVRTSWQSSTHRALIKSKPIAKSGPSGTLSEFLTLQLAYYTIKSLTDMTLRALDRCCDGLIRFAVLLFDSLLSGPFARNVISGPAISYYNATQSAISFFCSCILWYYTSSGSRAR